MLDNYTMCLIVSLCGVLAILKNTQAYKARPLFNCTSGMVVLSINIRTLSNFKIEKKNKKERWKQEII